MKKTKTAVEIGREKAKIMTIEYDKRLCTVVRQQNIHYEYGFSRESFNALFAPENHISSSELVISLDRAFFISRYILIPTKDAVELQQMIGFQIAKLVPVAVDELVFDYLVVSQDEVSSRVLIFVLPLKKVRPLFDCLIERKLDPVLIVSTSQGLAACEKPQGTVEIVSVEDRYVEYVVIEDECILFSRKFVCGSRGLDQELESTRNIFHKTFAGKEITDSRVYRAEDGGSGYESIEGALSLMPSGEMDFAPPQIIKIRRMKNNILCMLQFLVVIVQFVIIAGVICGYVIFDQNRKISALDDFLLEAKVELKQVQSVSDKIRIIEEKIADRIPVSDVIAEALSDIEGGLKLTSFELDSIGVLHIKGFARGINEVFDYARRLNGKDSFKEVRVKYATKIQGSDEEKIDFYISGRLDRR